MFKEIKMLKKKKKKERKILNNNNDINYILHLLNYVYVLKI